MKLYQIISLITVLLFSVGFVNASFAGHGNENFIIVHTSIQDCEEEVTVITHNVPKKDCYECKTQKFQEPESIKPTTSIRPVIVEEVERKKAYKKIETLDINVKFGENNCEEECKDTYRAPEFSNPHSIERKSIVTRIINFVYDCITW